MGEREVMSYTGSCLGNNEAEAKYDVLSAGPAAFGVGFWYGMPNSEL
jgi:hypothetical protein